MVVFVVAVVGGGGVTNMNTLFGETINTKPVSVRDIRREKARRAYHATSAIWKAKTYEFAVNEFLPHCVVFIFEELTILYRARERKRTVPVTVDARAFSGLQQRLVREGLIEPVPGMTRKRTNNSPSQVYRSRVYRSTVLGK